ncbi:putative adenosine deaminase [Ancylostoma ceylanicum]|uniref:Putative adenosine deaminase n=1 Tax=Ancylostoma ceylanicum TaxID=53326 RepID=A0A0D6LQ82_9BILA|nr:putative adenosine deaminase [Ancylostoma ceylanicum]
MVSELECRRLPKVVRIFIAKKMLECLHQCTMYTMLGAPRTFEWQHVAKDDREVVCEADVKLVGFEPAEEATPTATAIKHAGSLTTSREAVKTATIDVVREFAEDGVVYLELRSTPRATSEMTKRAYIEALIDGKGIDEGSREHGLVTRLLLSIDRRQSVEEAEHTVDMAAAEPSGLIVGIELSGNPSIDGRKFLPVLQRARKLGLKVSVHLAEVADQLDEVEEFLLFRPDRIGHGTYLHTQDRYIDVMLQNRIPLEICLSSNVMSMTTTTISDSHLRFWREKSIPFCICTDDKGLMDCDLSGEYYKASKAFDLTLNDLWDISKDALEMSFLDENSDDYKRLAALFAQRKLIDCN